jgi:hypothetical protein
MTVPQSLRPLVPESPDYVDRCPPFLLPLLNDFEPDGWQRTGQTWCVEIGMGGGAGMGMDTFKRQLRRYIVAHPNHGYGITDRNDAEIVISAFRPMEQ